MNNKMPDPRESGYDSRQRKDTNLHTVTTSKIVRFQIISGVIFLIISGASFVWVEFFPGEDCKIYGDCAGEGLTETLIVIPFATFGLLHLLSGYIKKQLRTARIILLIFAWLYLAYLLYPFVVTL